MSTLTSQSYVFDPRPNFPLLLTAKRYWDPTSPHVNDPDALTLIFAHGTSFHKEIYEPTLEDLYTLLDNTHDWCPKIREAWSIDCPNHGDAALLNGATLRWGYEPIFGWQEYARGIHAFLSGLGTGVDVDFSTRRLVFVGHSFAAAALVFALTYQPTLKPERLILLEIMCLRPSAGTKLMKFLTDGSENRRDVWPSREDAYKSFKTRQPWKGWDDRVLRKYVEHALTALPSLEYPDKEGVTLKCTRRQESAVYRDTLASSVVYRMMSSIVKRVPTHIIYGGLADYLPRDVQDEFLRDGVGGEQNLASLTRIPNAGHLAVQTHPREFAQIIFDILGKSKLPPARL
ncbi:Alpha/beta hydrolase fold-1 [Mycena alexandri]|uniref:Alpha/beta hydrolase fold-1 n=1 Tax=Mycena alexandri TaxID=1745969 RepID=A0AAD6SFZ2_9AGAR|nr:Alpha/beta hydrolase fold-1 [Mycena alexandri]